jgi:hypothetical protein
MFYLNMKLSRTSSAHSRASHEFCGSGLERRATCAPNQAFNNAGSWKRIFDGNKRGVASVGAWSRYKKT